MSKYFITTTTSSLDEYLQSNLPFYHNSFLDICNAYAHAISDTTRFNTVLFNVFGGLSNLPELL